MLTPLLLIHFYLVTLNASLYSNNVTKMSHFTTYNKDYPLKANKALQETPWGFQEIALEKPIEHNISSLEAYQHLIAHQSKLNEQGLNWKDNKVHIITFTKGTYKIPLGKSYYALLVPSKTIIQGAGMQKTMFKAVDEIPHSDPFHFRRLFNLEYATHDVVLRNFSFYNETQDNKWGLIHANGHFDRENYLFESIEFDDVFGAIGRQGKLTNFITFRGLRKRIGNTTQRIRKNFSVPVPINYQFFYDNEAHIELAGQIGIRDGHSIVFHDCVLGDNISATIDSYANYVEIVGTTFIDPLHDHSIKSPSGNHLYIHDSSFELRYTQKLINNTYWNPTFFTHEGGVLSNYHFKNLSFKRAGAIFNQTFQFVESEPFTLYDNRPTNVSGDMVWENIRFEGYSKKHQVVGYPNVQTNKGYEAINYTPFKGLPAQIKQHNKNARGNYHIDLQQGKHSSKHERKGVYSWGYHKHQSIDYPRDNKGFIGNKAQAYTQPYILMQHSTAKAKYNRELE